MVKIVVEKEVNEMQLANELENISKCGDILVEDKNTLIEASKVIKALAKRVEEEQVKAFNNLFDLPICFGEQEDEDDIDDEENYICNRCKLVKLCESKTIENYSSKKHPPKKSVK